MRRVPHRLSEIGYGGALGANIPQPGASGEAPDVGEVDYGAGDGRTYPARGAVYQDKGPGDVGAALQAPGGLFTNRVKPRFIFRPTTRVGTCRHYR